MNEFLADLYGTREAIGASNSSDVEKLAEAQVLDQVFKSEGINVDQLPDETIVKVAYELFGKDSAIVKAAETTEEEAKREGEPAEQEEGEKEEAKEEAKEEEKTAADLQKADFLGRVMAHSFVQERGIIEKNAAGGKATLLARLGKSMKGVGKSAKGGFEAAKAKGTEAAGAARKFVREHPGAVADAAVGLGAAGGFLVGRKTASALDVLAEKRATEILQENGVSTEQSEEVKLAEAVEQRAWEMLQAAGYVTE